MLATGTCDTVIAAVPLFDPLAAVIVALPGATAVTTPVCDTVAVAASLVLHVTGRLTTVPFASVTVAVSEPVWLGVSASVFGATVTLPTGTSVTVTVVLPLFPSLVAVTVADP